MGQFTGDIAVSRLDAEYGLDQATAEGGAPMLFALPESLASAPLRSNQDVVITGVLWPSWALCRKTLGGVSRHRHTPEPLIDS
jgi:hypothetical protein